MKAYSRNLGRREPERAGENREGFPRTWNLGNTSRALRVQWIHKSSCAWPSYMVKPQYASLPPFYLEDKYQKQGKPSILSVAIVFSRLLMCHAVFPGGAAGKETTFQHRSCRRPRFDSWVRKIPWRRAWQPTPVFLHGKSHGQRSLAGCSP